MKIVIFLILAASFLFAAMTYAFFWYETGNSNYKTYLAEIFGKKTALLILRAILAGTLSILLFFVLYPFGYIARLWNPARPDKSCTRPPVLLIHGYGHNRSAWIYYLFRLKRAGYKNAYTFHYPGIGSNFQDIAERLKKHIATISQQHNNHRVALIGHSLGGLLVRAVLKDPETAGRACAAATLCAAHQGSKLAVFAVSRLGRGLVYQGDLVSSINKTPSPDSPPKLNIYSPIDNLVIPPDALHTHEPGWTAYMTGPVSHINVLLDRKTADKAISFLDQACS